MVIDGKTPIGLRGLRIQSAVPDCRPDEVLANVTLLLTTYYVLLTTYYLLLTTYYLLQVLANVTLLRCNQSFAGSYGKSRLLSCGTDAMCTESLVLSNTSSYY